MYKEEGGELVVMMEGGTTKGGGSRMEVSKGAALLLLGAFVASLVGVALVTWRLSGCGPPNDPPGGASGHRFKPRLVDVRLPKSVVPESYHLRLIPFLQEGNFTFAGEVLIRVNVTQSTYNITLHSNELDILSTEVSRAASFDFSDSSDVPVSVSEKKFDSEREFCIIFFGRPLEPGQYKIRIKYRGYLNDALQGFYRSSYTFNGATRSVISLKNTLLQACI